MKKTRFAGLICAAATFAPLIAQASDGAITMAGNVVAATCTITAPASFTVTLPTMSTAQLNAAGMTGGTTQFTVALTACTASLVGAKMYFESGANVNAVTGRLKNTGTATGVEVQFVNATGTAIDLSKASGAQNATTAALASNAGSVTYAARYYATAAATSGTVASTVTYSMVYN